MPLYKDPLELVETHALRAIGSATEPSNMDTKTVLRPSEIVIT